MTGSQFFALAATIYVAPLLKPATGWVMVVLCMALSIVCRILEVA